MTVFCFSFSCFFAVVDFPGVLGHAGTLGAVSGPKFQEKQTPKNIESGLNRVAVPPFDAVSIAFDAGLPPAPFSQESGSPGTKIAKNP